MTETATRPNGAAPEGDKFRMGARGGLTGRAWQYVWDRLDRVEYRDGVELAQEAADVYGLKYTSVASHLRLAVRENYLATENRSVMVPVVKHGVEKIGRRVRTFYRIGNRS